MPPTPYTLRAATVADVRRLREIEVLAGVAFRVLGMDAVADDPPPDAAEYEELVRAGRTWVVADAADVAVAYAVADVVDGRAHVEQVSVDPAHAGHGLGRDLVEEIARWGVAQGLTEASLTTFRDVPWNGPYYERLGFRVLSPERLGPQLARLRENERAHGLDRWPRVAMVRDLT